eukprot:TRINITY_DN45815_c0_g1_i1.p1 TRINITY_DN45815_c0_g1~~TRINITY_DN45815_c0_g1_i1.p1  ORF type:complete len:305 (-),score=38.17 TRINITY_DN45815_c0_g1_i1:40-954(-)
MGRIQKALSTWLVAELAHAIFARRASSPVKSTLGTDSEAPGCFAVHVQAMCIQVTQHLVEGLSAHAQRKAPELKCLKPWCDEGRQECCDVYNELLEKFTGTRASLGDIREDTYKGFMWALELDGGSSEPPKPRRVRPPPQPVQITKPMQVDGFSKPSKPEDSKPVGTKTEAAAVKPTPPAAAAAQASSSSSDSGSQCYCSAGVGGVNQGSFALYAKSNWKVKGPEGKKCSTDISCKLCSRDGSPCCEVKSDGSMGECGARIHHKAVDWNSAKCLCGGLIKQKSSLCETPDQKCRDCNRNCDDMK